jgi:predicted glycoside hydrolase/deacetylase ChbG (UPF0249 family)
MLNNKNLIVNADDFGLSKSVNSAVLICYNKGYINSSSVLTNTPGFEEAVFLIKNNSFIKNVGIHINLAEGKPLVFNNSKFLDELGNWDINKTNKVTTLLNQGEQKEFMEEIYAQTDKAIASGISISHIDSHYHLHTLPCFYRLFLKAARHYKLKIRLAQTYREGSFIKYAYRKYINSLFIKNGLNYSERFETVGRFLNTQNANLTCTTEVMLHPDIDGRNELTDHVEPEAMRKIMEFLAMNEMNGGLHN